MTRPWAAERVVDGDEARVLVASVATSLVDARFTALGAGWDNTAWLVEDGGQRLVFRFPRRLVAVGCMENELLALPLLPPLSLPLTRPLFSGRMPAATGAPDSAGSPDSDTTWPFAGYPHLDGEVLATALAAEVGPLALSTQALMAIGHELGVFLRALHSLDPKPWLDRGLTRDPIARLDVARRLEPVSKALSLVEREGLDTRPHREALERAMTTVLPPMESLCHGDLDPRHVLIRAGHTSGLIDWGDVNIGHPAMDLGLAFALPRAARQAFFAAYGPIAEETMTLARARAIMSAARVYEWARDIGDPPLAAYARTALGHTEPETALGR